MAGGLVAASALGRHLDIGPSSVVSHEAAAALHGLATFRPGPVVLSVAHGDHHRRRPFKVRQCTDLRPEDIGCTEGLPVTSPARTLFDLAATCRRHRLERALDEAHVDGTCRIEEVAAVFHALQRRGKRGMRMLRSLLARRGPGFVPPESVLERRLLRVLRDGGLPEPCSQFRLPWRPASGERVDFAYPAAKVLIEADGRRWHSRMTQMATDRARDREVLNQGWRPYRFVWEDITERPDDVCGTLRAALTGSAKPVSST